LVGSAHPTLALLFTVIATNTPGAYLNVCFIHGPEGVTHGWVE
jgi:hypothetical protein